MAGGYINPGVYVSETPTGWPPTNELVRPYQHQIWRAWADSSTAACDTITTTASTAVWHHWVTGSTVTGSTVTGDVGNTPWDAWVSDATTGASDAVWHQWVLQPAPTWRQPRLETAEERRAREEHWVRVLARQEAEEKRRQAERAAQAHEFELAEARAQKLLYSLLSEEQIHSYEKHGYFFEYVDVPAGEGSQPETRKYKVSNKWHGNLERRGVGKLKRTENLCVHHPSYVGGKKIPLADHLASQVLHLRFAESELRRRANITLH
jgi:hypothetical protein